MDESSEVWNIKTENILISKGMVNMLFQVPNACEN